MTTKPTVRCPFTKLTRPQINAIWSVLLDCRLASAVLPHGVWRSLVIRGLIFPDHTLTKEGQALFARSSFLSDKMKAVMLARARDRK